MNTKKAGLTLNIAKCENLIVGNEEIIDLTFIDGDYAKYLRVIFNKEEHSKKELIRKFNKI